MAPAQPKFCWFQPVCQISWATVRHRCRLPPPRPDAGLSSKDLAERYHVSRAWVDALKQRRRETGSIEALKQTKFRGRVLAGHEAQLAALVAARPDATLAELREALRTSAALATVWRELDRLQLTVKKNVWSAPDLQAAHVDK